MRDYVQQGITTLEAIRRRGQEAINALVNDDQEQALELMRLRTAAFHNYRALDAVAMRNGINLTENATILEKFRECREVDQKLEAAMTESMEGSKRQLARIMAARKTINQFRSGTVENKNFEYSV